jgi:hypothetical protein
LRQIEATRNQPGANGNVHFSMKALMRNYDGIADRLKAGPYAEPALVPESSWLGDETLPRPEVEARPDGTSVAIEMKLPSAGSGDPHTTSNAPWQWIVHVQTESGWHTAIVPGRKTSHVVRLADVADAKQVVVSAVTRLSREGPSARIPIVAGTLRVP